MVARAGTLTDALLDWVGARLVMASSTAGVGPSWPVSAQCSSLLQQGRLAEALELPDNPDARYVITGHVRPGARHLLLARDVELDREVVIKLIRAPGRIARAAAVHEGRLLARMKHPHVLTVHEVDCAGAYLVVERLEGDLRDYLNLDRGWLLDALCGAGRGLAAVHASGLWHGDFKLDNVLVEAERDQDGRVTGLRGKLGDFGEAAQGAGPGADWLFEDSDAPPPCNPLEDQRAFAAAVWEALAMGQLAPLGGELIPPPLRAVLERALMPEASQRWADMTALVDAIERGRAGTAAESRHTRDPASGRPGPLALAMFEAEDACYSQAREHWRDAERLMAGQHRALGEGGGELAKVVLGSVSTRRTDDERGLLLALEVLRSATRHLHVARRRQAADETHRVAIEACARLVRRYPIWSANRRHAKQLFSQLRVQRILNDREPSTVEDTR